MILYSVLVSTVCEVLDLLFSIFLSLEIDFSYIMFGLQFFRLQLLQDPSHLFSHPHLPPSCLLYIIKMIKYDKLKQTNQNKTNEVEERETKKTHKKHMLSKRHTRLRSSGFLRCSQSQNKILCQQASLFPLTTAKRLMGTMFFF